MKQFFRDLFYTYMPKKVVIDYIARKVIGRNINWKHPYDINDKINILKLSSDTSLWTMLSDKYMVRNYITQKGLEHILIPLYAKWNSVNEIDFGILPSSFVLKTNHGCGEVIIVKDKTKTDEAIIRSNIEEYMKYRYGLHQAEYHYLNIQPCIIAEALLEEPNTQLSTTMIDYKIWCFNGQPFCIFVCYNRSKKITDIALYDTKWEYIRNGLKCSSHFRENGDIIPKPKNFEKMLEYASKLADGFKEVRVDLYNVDGAIYFGEMTFTSLGGFMNYFSDDFLVLMGKQFEV